MISHLMTFLIRVIQGGGGEGVLTVTLTLALRSHTRATDPHSDSNDDFDAYKPSSP